MVTPVKLSGFGATYTAGRGRWPRCNLAVSVWVAVMVVVPTPVMVIEPVAVSILATLESLVV